MADALEKALALSFIVVGLSHVVAPRAWSAFFVDLFSTRCGAFAIAMYTFPVGLLFILGHNQWEWRPGVIATIYGWGSLVKATLYFLYPKIVDLVAKKKVREPRNFVIAGSVCTAAGLSMAFDLLRRMA